MTNNPLEQFSSLWDELDPKLASLVVEARELREAVSQSKETDSVSTMHANLLAGRRSLDRLEAIVAEVGRLRARAKISVSDAKDAYEEAMIAVMQKTRIGEYTSADERRMTYKAACFDEYRTLRKAEKYEAAIAEVYDYCLMRYRGLDSSRKDLDTRIRLISLQSALES